MHLFFPAETNGAGVDLQGNFRYQSDRVQRANYGNTATELFLKPEGDRTRNPYYYYKDYNGLFFLQTTENINVNWQTDYATVDFTYVTPDHSAFPDKDIYVIGSLNGYSLSDSGKMVFNADKGVYQSSLFLKNGFYNYAYVTVNKNDPNKTTSFEFTEGNHLETENDYTILVYYRQLGGRADELVGYTKLNTLTANQ